MSLPSLPTSESPSEKSRAEEGKAEMVKEERAGGGVGVAKRRGTGEKPPEWAVERWVKGVGRGPAALGKQLDRLAGRRGIGPIVRFFSSVWVGIGVLVLLAIYIGIGSGFPSLRAKLEMTDLQFFDAMPMRILLVLLALDLIIVTLRRIPMTLFKLGAWIVHVGILTLIGGSVWYFSHKLEGSVRLFLNKPVGAYYDATERALYAFKMSADGKAELSTATMTDLPGLPIYNEHLAEQGTGLHRVLPAGTLGELDPRLKGVGLEITGYYPCAEMETRWAAGPKDSLPAGAEEPNPAIRVSMALGGVSGGEWLVGKSPVERVLDGQGAPFGVEYLYHPDPQRVADLETAFKGPTGITVHVKLPNGGHVDRSYTVQEGDVVKVEGTPYTLRVGGQVQMPMMSEGYKGAMSDALTLSVTRADKAGGGGDVHFDRMSLARYPERSPDFIKTADGKQKRIQDRVDHDIEIGFHDCSKDQFWVVEGTDGKMTLIHRKIGGAVETLPLVLKKPVDVEVGKVGMTVTVLEKTSDAVGVQVPRIIPVQFRQRGQTAMDAMQQSVIEMEVKMGEGGEQTIYVPFSPFAEVGEPPAGREPAVVNVPGVGKVGFLMSTLRRELPSVVTLTGFEAKKYPGAANSYEDFVSTLDVKEKKSGLEKTLVPHLNEPATDQGLSYFQAAWDGDDHAPATKRFSVIGVGNRPGIWVMMAGAILMVLGIGYAFYVKPILLNKKKQELAEWAKKRAGS